MGEGKNPYEHDKKDCVVMLEFLISHNTNSATPTGENKNYMDKSSYMRSFESNRNGRSQKSPISANPFLRNVFPCTTEPDSVGSPFSINEMKSSRFKPKEKFEAFSESLKSLPENTKETN